MSRRPSLQKQAQDIFDSKLRIGESKFAAKKAGASCEYIYSWNSYKTYLRQACAFLKWCKSLHPDVKTVADCRQHVDAYLLQHQESGYTAYTLKTQAAALAKLYGCSISDFVITFPRRRADIVRGRGVVGRPRFSEEKHADLVQFCRCTGLRRAELEQLRGTDLATIDGVPHIHVQRASKGGKERYAPIIGSPSEIAAVCLKMRSAASEKVFGKVSSHANIHGYRAEYAQRFYDQVARPVETIRSERMVIRNNKIVDVYNGPRRALKLPAGCKDVSAVYYCNADKAGVWYDRAAMFRVSQALGHNRESIIASHYLIEQ